jgi:2',3'-cyclic-nucleotide 2'-phosphodiesterase (5'-nucleotidase family)
MSIPKKLLFVVVILAFVACSPKTWIVTQRSSTKIAIDSSLDKIADKSYETYLQPFKQKIDRRMNVVIGQAAETMTGHAPESLLSNFNADVYRQAAANFLGGHVDLGVVNLGGLRTTIPAGNITLGKVFELMPFENELVIVWLKGDKLYDLLQFFASIGGEGVSGLRMGIHDGKAVNITIEGQPLDKNKLYSIATNDYVAGGNDKMIQMAQYEKRVNTGLKIRNVLINAIESETRQGHKIQSKLDGRITIIP